MAVAPARATISTVTIGPIWVMVPRAAPAPERSCAPISRSRMLSVKLTSTVNGMATSSVGTIDTRAIAHDCSTVSRHWNGRWNNSRANDAECHEITDSPEGCRQLVQHRLTPSPSNHRETYHAQTRRNDQFIRALAENVRPGSRSAK